MQMMLIKCLLFLFTITGIEGLEMLRKRDHFSVHQRTMKRILESCFKKDNLAEPIIIFGDFTEFIDKRSIIRMNSFVKIDEAHEKRQLLNTGASKVILSVDSLEELKSYLLLLKKTRWWNPKVPHFIINKNNRLCKGSKHILMMTWHMDIVNSIYICANSRNHSILMTINPMGMDAPYPWRRTEMENRSSPSQYIFHQHFPRNFICKNLNYDKTKLLRNYTIKMVEWLSDGRQFRSRVKSRKFFNLAPWRHYKLLRSIIKALNAKPRLELENYERAIMVRIGEGTADVAAAECAPEWFPNTTLGHNFPHIKATIVAVVRLKSEVTTLEKIRKIWSKQVLISAAIFLIILWIILTITNHDFFLAMLDIIRLLVYTSILTINKSHPFRIFFTTMLILMVISNGVFQGKIAAFLTTQERGSAPGTMNELAKLGYKMYTTLGLVGYVRSRLPKYDIGIVANESACIQLVLDNGNNLCFISEASYEEKYILYPLDCVKERWNGVLHFISRHNWPLENRFNDMIMRHVESGIIDFWKMNATVQPKKKREAMEAEWSSSQYKPVRLYKLTFAFQLLGIGLSLSTFVFFLELLVAKYGSC